MADDDWSGGGGTVPEESVPSGWDQPLGKDYSELDKVESTTPPPPGVDAKTQSQNADVVDEQQKLMSKTKRDRDTYYDKLQEINKTAAQLYEQSLSQAPQQLHQASYSQPPNTDQFRQQAFAKAMLLFGVGTAAALMLGRHNKYAFGSAMTGLAAGINNIAKGYKTEATEALATWNKQNEYIKEENKQRMDQMKEILINNKLALSDKMKLLKTYADGYQMPYLRDAAEQKDLHKATQEIDKMEKAEAAREKKTWEMNKHLLPNEAAEYEQAKQKDPDLKYSDFLRLKHMQMTKGKKKKAAATSEGASGGLTSPEGADIFGVTGDSPPTDEQKKAFEETMSGG